MITCSHHRAAIAAAVLCAVLSHSSDAVDNPHLWAPQVTSVSVFKNGLGFFTREGAVALDEGWCLARRIPPAAFGTLAIYSHARRSDRRSGRRRARSDHRVRWSRRTRYDREPPPADRSVDGHERRADLG